MAEIKSVDRSADQAFPGVDFLLGLDTQADKTKEVFRIGDLSREFGVTLRTLRFYEDRGLLRPERRGTTRLYSRRDRARLRLILLAKLLGFSLTEAKQMIELYDQPDGEKKQLEVALDRFAEQQEVLEEQLTEIRTSIEAMKKTMTLMRSRLSELS